MENIDELIYAKEIINKYNLGDSFLRINTGFNRSVFDVNNEYILKICTNTSIEKGTKNEIKFLLTNNDEYCPKLYMADDTKKIIPYIYTIEEKLHGNSLLSIWNHIDISKRKKYLFELVEILKKVHKSVTDYDCMNIVSTFDVRLNNCIQNNIFSEEQIEYLKILEKNFDEYLVTAKKGYIHGDLHFNNIIITENGMKLIDFENYGKSLLDKEFDSIRRMVRNPNSFIRNGESKEYYDESYYTMIMDYLKELYPELCKEDNFYERLLIYDCLNAIRWVPKFPDYQPYYDILFNDSKKLLKK